MVGPSLLARLRAPRSWLSSVAERFYRPEETPPFPAVFHVTHWKAGSQWLRKILWTALPGRVAVPEQYPTEFQEPLSDARIYPALCATRQEFDELALPPGARRFVVFRDLRDTLVSAYFSIKASHRRMGNRIWDGQLLEQRAQLNSLSREEGFLYLIDEWLPASANIQSSWADGAEPFVRYEDLLNDDLDILERILLDECQLPIAREHLRSVILRCRFERLSGGRPRGQEDRRSHERKGIAGDWVNHFSERVKDAFKERFGDVLVATGYERNLHW